MITFLKSSQYRLRLQMLFSSSSVRPLLPVCSPRGPEKKRGGGDKKKRGRERKIRHRERKRERDHSDNHAHSGLGKMKLG